MSLIIIIINNNHNRRKLKTHLSVQSVGISISLIHHNYSLTNQHACAWSAAYTLFLFSCLRTTSSFRDNLFDNNNKSLFNDPNIT